jgi:AraC-like DNA-binding protein
VERGDVDGLKALLSGPMPDTEQISGYAFSHSREMEYMTVSSITLMTRAAIAGGVPLELAHQLGTVYMNRLAKAVDQGAGFVSLGYNAMLEFTELVRRCREEKSAVSYVDACKQYIEDNFRKQLQVGEIAPAIGLSRTYLSRLFHEAEGITVQQYIQKVRCRHAAQMLQYSDYPIAQIALYNGFSSQSYFGACFQSWYGMTPNAYRKANR